ncbi:hypothetical protein [Herbiconiux liukaitaii]|uniref:hypothetical protein n=1 Tax=Herbiconiux liukaitaii TaxID=3342799 RepID=UPI0035BA9387
MSEPTSTLEPTIAAFAAAVRRHLDDLPLEEVDDLTGGLEADLAEQASDEGGHLELGDPAAYATELRASAGLPARGNSSAPLRQRLARGLHSLEAATLVRARSTRLGAWLADFAVSLRPVWWVLRGWALYQLLTILLLGLSGLVPSSLPLWVLLFAAIVLSVQWGRGRWAPGRVLRAVRVAVSVVAVVTLPFFAAWALNEVRATSGDDYAVSYTDPTGLQLDGQRVTNIFGYDAAGNPVTDLQLFDQDGDPLVTVGDALLEEPFDYFSTDGTTVTVPFANAARGTGWNIFPLREVPLDDMGNADLSEATPATPPFRTTNPVPASPTPTPTPTPTAAPTAGPDPTPTPTPTPAPTPSADPTPTPAPEDTTAQEPAQ